MSISHVWKSADPEFWLVWSEAIPLVFFVYFCWFAFDSVNDIEWLLCLSVILSRACSLLYHVAHRYCASLYKLDLVGICCMVLGCPWVASKAELEHTSLYLYQCLVLAWLLLALYDILKYSATRALVVLAIIANGPTLFVCPWAVTALTGGYLVFWCKVPECWWPSLQSGPWQSHALWHYSVTAAQTFYLRAMWA